MSEPVLPQPAVGPLAQGAAAVAGRLGLRRPLVFLDLEATGLDVERDRIVEFAGVRIEPDGGASLLTLRLDPGIEIPAEATAVHGIADDAVRGAPRFEAVASSLAEWLQGADLAGYNHARYDLPLLEAEFARAGLVFDWRGRRLVDVSAIFRRMEPRSLTGAVRFYCGRELQDAHSAVGDVTATLDVFLGQMERYPDLANDLDGLDEFTRPREDRSREDGQAAAPENGERE